MLRRARTALVLAIGGIALGLLAPVDLSPSTIAALLGVGGSLFMAFGAPGSAPSPADAALAAGALGAAHPYVALGAASLLLALVFGLGASRAQTLREGALHVTLAFAGGVAAAAGLDAEGVPESAWLLGVVLAAFVTAAPALVSLSLLREGWLTLRLVRAEAPDRRAILRAIAAGRRSPDQRDR